MRVTLTLYIALNFKISDPNIRIFTSQFAADEKFGQSAKQCSLRTPHDISSTHIIAFPTSATRVSRYLSHCI